MKYKIITISREFGSGVRAIGRELADELGIKYYDRDIIARVAEKTGLGREFIEKKGEYAHSKNIFSYAFIGRDATGATMDDYLFKAQKKIIEDIAEKEPCVIIGRCADFILKNRQDCLNVFICGDEDEKARRICQLYEKSESEARKLMKDTDKKRAINYKYYTDKEWGRTKNYDICLNSNRLGYKNVIDVLKKLY